VPSVHVCSFGSHFLKPLGVGIGGAVLGFPIHIGDHVSEVPAHKQGFPERGLVRLGVSDDRPDVGFVSPQLWRLDRIGRKFPHRAFAPIGDVADRFGSLAVLAGAQELPLWQSLSGKRVEVRCGGDGAGWLVIVAGH
jgi:hypothetical protein